LFGNETEEDDEIDEADESLCSLCLIGSCWLISDWSCELLKVYGEDVDDDMDSETDEAEGDIK
jgi:hypothetical protein